MFSPKKWLQKLKSGCKQRGDTILEVVVATVILGAILVATFNILQRAIDTNLNIKNRVVALNIAREGIEAVRNVRDTNWLKYSGDRRKKWLCLDQVGVDSCHGSTVSTDFINGNNAALPAFYTVDFNETRGRYYLERKTLQNWIDFLETGQAVSREEYRLYQTAVAPQRYTHDDGAGNAESVFYRQVQLEIQNPYDSTAPSFCDDSPSEDTCTKARLKVVVRVFWQEEGRQRSVALETHLFDFFERDEY